MLVIGIVLGIRPTSMHQIELSQFEKRESKWQEVILFTKKIVSKTGASKTQRGGIATIKKEPVPITL